MESQKNLDSLPELLLPWYQQNHRDLPWRKDKEFYHVWISEIMLQQTRVEAVKGYYARFLQALPSIEALAACPEEQLHKLWEGLGYYSRVRNLKKAAVQIMEQGGQPPDRFETVLQLPGIGPYTAGAICSICFDQKTPAVDGNVLRVLSRLQNDPSPIDLPETKKAVTQQLRKIYPAAAGMFTQALMELGATLCGPNRAPDCDRCPCREICRGYLAGNPESLPKKSPKRPRKQEEKTVFILSCGERYAVAKRKNQGLLAGLWEFPNIPGTLSLEKAMDFLRSEGITVKEVYQELYKNHIFTHIEWKMKGIYLEIAQESEKLCWYTPREIQENLALPTAFRQFWEDRRDV